MTDSPLHYTTGKAAPSSQMKCGFNNVHIVVLVELAAVTNSALFILQSSRKAANKNGTIYPHSIAHNLYLNVSLKSAETLANLFYRLENREAKKL